jgi:hypothetical protein
MFLSLFLLQASVAQIKQKKRGDEWPFRLNFVAMTQSGEGIFRCFISMCYPRFEMGD